ncbi:MAG: response regulator [Verrucomicrobia bacterium]|nr:response regulator [Verrucomicrobiota bacterium]
MTQKTILYVEDSDVDVFFMQRVFEKLDALDCLRVVHNGENAILYLAGVGGFGNRQAFPLPALVLLDLNLPGKQGFDVLEWIRQQPQFQWLPVVIFSASALEADRKRAKELGANDYIVKPNDMTRVSDLLSSVFSRFLNIAAHVEDGPRSVVL